jgi:hypothetical protein
MNLGIVDKLKKAAWGVLGVLVAVFLVVGFFTWASNNQAQFTRVASSAGNAAANVAVTTFDWISAKAGGSAATTGPEVIYVQNDAPLRWHVGAAIKVWNKGLTNVQLQAVQTCPSDGICFKVSQVSELPRENGRLVMGRTSTLFGKSIRFNGEVVGQVNPALFPVAACHELGHALGAEHSTSMKSCMHATVSAGVSTRPDKADYAAVNAKYGN